MVECKAASSRSNRLRMAPFASGGEGSFLSPEGGERADLITSLISASDIVLARGGGDGSCTLSEGAELVAEGATGMSSEGETSDAGRTGVEVELALRVSMARN